MPTPRKYSRETQEEVLSMLRAGELISEVSSDFEIPYVTVKRWADLAGLEYRSVNPRNLCHISKVETEFCSSIPRINPKRGIGQPLYIFG